MIYFQVRLGYFIKFFIISVSVYLLKLSVPVQENAEQRAKPLLRVEQIRKPDIRVHLYYFLG